METTPKNGKNKSILIGYEGRRKKQEKEINKLETYWALEKAKDYTQLDECPF